MKVRVTIALLLCSIPLLSACGPKGFNQFLNSLPREESSSGYPSSAPSTPAAPEGMYSFPSTAPSIPASPAPYYAPMASMPTPVTSVPAPVTYVPAPAAPVTSVPAPVTYVPAPAAPVAPLGAGSTPAATSSSGGITFDDLISISTEVRAANPGKSESELGLLIMEAIKKRKMGIKSSFHTQSLNFEGRSLNDAELDAFISRPDLILATIEAYGYAQRKTNEVYGGVAATQNNQVDAFRHAAWNIALARKAMEYGWDISLDKGLGWAKTFSDAHEEVPNNPPLAKAMDIHNNRAGRLLIRDYPNPYDNVYTIMDKVALLDARFVTSEEEIAAAGEKTLVYIRR